MHGVHGSDTDADRPHAAHPEPARRGGSSHLGWIAVGLIGLVGGGIFLSHRSKSNAAGDGSPAGSGSAAPENRVVPVVVAAAELRDVPVYLDAIGNATPLATVTVRSQVDGRLDKVLFTEGQTVKKGQVIAQIDPRPFTIALHLAQASVANGEAQRVNAQRNLERYQNLVGQKLIPQQQLDDQQSTLDQSKAAIAGAQANVENARLQLDYAAIKSPLDGVTGVRLVDPGNIVHASDPGGIVVVTQLDPMAVLFTLPQDDLPRVALELAAGPLTVQAFTRDGGTNVGTGRLELVDNQVNQSTATIRLKAIFPNPKRVLWPNAFLKIKLLLTTKKDALVIPAAAIQRGPQGSFVYVVDGDNKATMRAIKTDFIEDELAVIAQGLSAGDSVVTEGQNQLRPGSKVAPRQASAAPGGGAPGNDHGSGQSEGTPGGHRHGGPKPASSGAP